jgi:hypothetical protein
LFSRANGKLPQEIWLQTREIKSVKLSFAPVICSKGIRVGAPLHETINVDRRRKRARIIIVGESGWWNNGTGSTFKIQPWLNGLEVPLCTTRKDNNWLIIYLFMYTTRKLVNSKNLKRLV